jgi:hypothetical protein
MTRLARTFEQSTQARVGNHYKPSRARFDEAEIERRRAQAGTNTLVVEYQQTALERVVLQMLDAIEDPHEQAIAAQLLGGALFSTATYLTTPDNDPRMRHNFKLPQIADNEGWRQTPEGFKVALAQDLAEAARLSEELANLRRERLPVRNLPMKVGKAIGKAGLDLSIYPLTPTFTETRADYAQMTVREHAQNMQDAAIRLGESVDMNLSAAMLVDEFSPIGVHIQKEAPDAVVQAYDEVLTAYKLAA